jgi:hypothetical protein
METIFNVVLAKIAEKALERTISKSYDVIQNNFPKYSYLLDPYWIAQIEIYYMGKSYIGYDQYKENGDVRIINEK